MAQGEFKKYCQICGCVFLAKGNNAKYCPACRKEQQYLQNKKNEQASRIKKKASLLKSKSLNDLMWELKAYNEKHHTKLSYGEYVAMIEGHLKRGVVG